MDGPRYTDGTQLFPGDEVRLTYDLIDWGTWLIAYQTGKVEEQLEADPLITYVGYIYHDQLHRVTFRCKVRAVPKEQLPQMQEAGGLATVGYVAAAIAAAGIAWYYAGTQIIEIIRAKAAAGVLDNPDATPEQIQAATDELLNADESVLVATAKEIKTSVVAIVVGGLVLYYLTKG